MQVAIIADDMTCLVVRLYLKYGVSPYNRTTVLRVFVVRLYQKTPKFSTNALHDYAKLGRDSRFFAADEAYR